MKVPQKNNTQFHFFSHIPNNIGVQMPLSLSETSLLIADALRGHDVRAMRMFAEDSESLRKHLAAARSAWAK